MSPLYYLYTEYYLEHFFCYILPISLEKISLLMDLGSFVFVDVTILWND